MMKAHAPYFFYALVGLLLSLSLPAAEPPAEKPPVEKPLAEKPSAEKQPGELRAGTALVDITPTKFPVIVNGGFLEGSAKAVVDPLYARALVLANEQTMIAIVVVDSCMLPRELLDR